MMDDNRTGPVWVSFEKPAKAKTFRPAIFLDRDGVINRNRSDYVKSWDEFRFLPSTLETIARLATTPYYVIVLTNQSAIGRGIVAPEAIEDIHRRMVDGIRNAGGRVDAVAWCPHKPDEGCGCRKPSPGMFHEAEKRLPVSLAASYFVGDAQSDIQAAQAAGCHPVLVLSGRITPAMLKKKCVDLDGVAVQKDLRAAVTWILSR